MNQGVKELVIGGEVGGDEKKTSVVGADGFVGGDDAAMITMGAKGKGPRSWFKGRANAD